MKKLTSDETADAIMDALDKINPILDDTFLHNISKGNVQDAGIILITIASQIAAEAIVKSCFFFTPEGSEEFALNHFPALFDQIRTEVFDQFAQQRAIKEKLMAINLEKLLAKLRATYTAGTSPKDFAEAFDIDSLL